MIPKKDIQKTLLREYGVCKKYMDQLPAGSSVYHQLLGKQELIIKMASEFDISLEGE